jgi:hypothetical protein
MRSALQALFPALIKYIEDDDKDEYKYNTERRAGFQEISTLVMTGSHIKSIDLMGGQ